MSASARPRMDAGRRQWVGTVFARLRNGEHCQKLTGVEGDCDSGLGCGTSISPASRGEALKTKLFAPQPA